MVPAFSSGSSEAGVAVTTVQTARYTNDMELKKDARVTNERSLKNSIETLSVKDSDSNNTNHEDYNNGDYQVIDKEVETDSEQNDEFASHGPLVLTDEKTGSDTPLPPYFSQHDRNEDDLGDDDGELSYFLESFCERDVFSRSVMKVATERSTGVNEHRKHEKDLVTVPNPKRVVLSSIADQGPGSLKRRKIGENLRCTFLLATPITALPVSPQDSTDTECVTRLPAGIPLIAPSDDEALDEDLCEELAKHGEGGDISRTSTPVALLTPPQSPLTIEVDGIATTICEWPSNLAVDSAMTAAINDIRPMSPESLQRFDEVEESRVANLIGVQASSEANL